MKQDFVVCSWPKEWIGYSIVHPSILIWMDCNLYEIYYLFAIFTLKFIALRCRLVAAKHVTILQDYDLVWSLEKFYLSIILWSASNYIVSLCKSCAYCWLYFYIWTWWFRLAAVANWSEILRCHLVWSNLYFLGWVMASNNLVSELEQWHA